MKIKIEKTGGFSSMGYYHIPILYLAFGRGGFILCILTFDIIITWKHKSTTDIPQ